MDFPLEIFFPPDFASRIISAWIHVGLQRTLHDYGVQHSTLVGVQLQKKAKWGAADSVTCIGRCYWNHASLLPASVDPLKLRQQLAQIGQEPRNRGEERTCPASPGFHGLIVSVFFSSDSGHKKPLNA